MLTYKISDGARYELCAHNLRKFKLTPDQLKLGGVTAWDKIFKLFGRGPKELGVFYVSRIEFEKLKKKPANFLAEYNTQSKMVFVILTNVLKKMDQCKIDPFHQLVYLHAHEFTHANDDQGTLGLLRARLISSYLRKSRHMGIISITELIESEELLLLGFLHTFREGRAKRIEHILLAKDGIDPPARKKWFEPFNGHHMPSFKGIGVLDYAEFIRRLEVLERVGVWNQLEPTKEEILHPERFERRINELYDYIRNSELFLDNVLLPPSSWHAFSR